jgi:hypothetical protein
MDEFLKEENYLNYGELSRKVISMEMVYSYCDRGVLAIDDRRVLKDWATLGGNQEELLNFIQDETQAARSRGKVFWLLWEMANLYKYQKTDICVAYPRVNDVHILLRLFLKLFGTDKKFRVWAWFYSDFVSDLGDVAIPYFYKHLDNRQLAPPGPRTGQEKLWLDRFVMYSYRYADYAAWCIERITKIPLPFHEDYSERVKEIAIFKTKIQAYCAERGIKLE